MIDLEEKIDKDNKELCELQSCIEIVQTILNANMKNMGVSDNGDYPHQMEIVLAMCAKKVEELIESNNNLYKAA